MPFTTYPIDQLRHECKHRLEILELALRRLIDQRFTTEHGANYFQTLVEEQYLFSKAVRERACEKKEARPERYPQLVDALLFDDLIVTVCKPAHWKGYFRSALITAFPDGCEEARTYLSRLVTVRNSLAHANPISYHDSARVFAYSEDVLVSIREYYQKMSGLDEFNAPTFVSFRDSLGNSDPIRKSRQVLNYTSTILRPGDRVRFEVDVDDSFSADLCSVRWTVNNISNPEMGTGRSFCLELTNRHVGEVFALTATLMSEKEWHRHGNFDAHVILNYKVLPPL